MATPSRLLRGTLGRSQDVCKGAQFLIEGERCVVSNKSRFKRLTKKKKKQYASNTAKEQSLSTIWSVRKWQVKQSLGSFPRKALRRGISASLSDPLHRSWSRLSTFGPEVTGFPEIIVGIDTFEIPPRRALRGDTGKTRKWRRGVGVGPT